MFTRIRGAARTIKKLRTFGHPFSGLAFFFAEGGDRGRVRQENGETGKNGAGQGRDRVSFCPRVAYGALSDGIDDLFSRLAHLLEERALAATISS